MNSEDCDTTCAPLEPVCQGKLVVTATADAEDNTDFAGCKYNLIKEETCTYPAIPVSFALATLLRDGSALHPIEVEFIAGNMIRPIIMDEAGIIKRYEPKQELGKKRVVVVGRKFSFLPYVFPGLIANDLDEMGSPDFYLGANKVTRICDPLDGPVPIQLLKITVEEAPPIAVDDAIEVEFETPFNFDAAANDSGVGIEVTAVSNPPNGTATIELDGTITYEPDPGHEGADSFTYTITDDNLLTDTATVVVNVLPASGDIEDLAGLRIWMDASLLVGSDASNVETLPELSNNINDFTWQGGCNSRPTLQTAEQNGLNVLRFDGTLNAMAAQMNPNWGLTNNGSIFIVSKRFSGSSGAIFMFDAPNSTNRLGLYFTAAGDIVVDWGSAAGGTGRRTFTFAAPTVWCVLSLVRTVNTLRIYLDGALIATPADYASAFNWNSNLDVMLLGADASCGGWNQFDLGEFVIANTAVSNSVRHAIEVALGAKWGIAIAP